MSESLTITATEKEALYAEIMPQIASVLANETNVIANLANTSAILKECFNFFWVGFYLVDETVPKGAPEQLVLGPFQGPLACTRIRKGKGVCGNAWQECHTLIVPDVEKFPGHIACSSLSKSEIVVPIIKEKKVVGVLDIDSEKVNIFDTVDQLWLEQLAELLATKIVVKDEK